MGRRAKNALVVAAAAVIVYLPQTLVSHALFGTWLTPPQLHAGWGPDLPLFSWSSPHLVDALLSARRGVFTWHPVYALAVLGLVPLWRRDRWLAAAVVAGVLGQAYVIGGWYDWTQGWAFGGRAFIGCLPLFTVSFAALLDAVSQVAARRRSAVRVAVGVAALLLAANLLLAIEYRLVLSRNNRATTWYDLGIGRVIVPVRYLSGLKP